VLEPQGGVKSSALATMDLSSVRAIVTNGSSGASVALMQRMPQLKIVCCFGAGYEGVDLAYTREHGIALTNAPGVNDDTARLVPNSVAVSKVLLPEPIPTVSSAPVTKLY
jgi:lactate dehydrogenase-like 2-hydroxyacid dehydrogenase